MAESKRTPVKLYLVALVDYRKPKSPAPVVIDGQSMFVVAAPTSVEDIDAWVGMQAGVICGKAGIDPQHVEPHICPFSRTR